MKQTGIFLTPAEMLVVEGLLHTKMKMDFKTNITVTTPPDKKAVGCLINDLAVEKGLPRLPDNEWYGLTSDRELVSA